MGEGGGNANRQKGEKWVVFACRVVVLVSKGGCPEGEKKQFGLECRSGKKNCKDQLCSMEKKNGIAAQGEKKTSPGKGGRSGGKRGVVPCNKPSQEKKGRKWCGHNQQKQTMWSGDTEEKKSHPLTSQREERSIISTKRRRPKWGSAALGGGRGGVFEGIGREGVKKDSPFFYDKNSLV